MWSRCKEHFLFWTGVLNTAEFFYVFKFVSDCFPVFVTLFYFLFFVLNCFQIPSKPCQMFSFFFKKVHENVFKWFKRSLLTFMERKISSFWIRKNSETSAQCPEQVPCPRRAFCASNSTLPQITSDFCFFCPSIMNCTSCLTSPLRTFPRAPNCSQLFPSDLLSSCSLYVCEF